jgi:hypothetical protein
VASSSSHPMQKCPPEVIRTEEQLPKTTAPPKTSPSTHPLPKPIAPPQIDPTVQSLPNTTAPPPYNDPQPTTTQKTTPITIPTVAEPQASQPPRLLTTPLPNTRITINPHTASPSPPKIPPSSTINKPLHHPQYQPPKSHSPTTLFLISSTHHYPYLKTTHCQPQTKRTKPKKPPPQLKPYPFHTDWSRRRKRARFKTRHFLGRRKPLAVPKFGMNGSGRGKKDPGLGKRGPKKKRQERRDNVRGFKVLEIRRLARKRLGEQTGPWLRSPFTGWRQGTGLGRMGSEPENPTKCGSPPDGVFGHRRPPSRPPDGDYAKGGDSGVNHSSPEYSIEHRDEPPCDPVTDAEIPADDRRFPVSEVDRGGCS